MSEPQSQQQPTAPGAGTIYSVPHPKAFTPQSYILLDKSCNEAARTGPTFLDLLRNEETGKGFLKNIFTAISQARTVDGRKQDFFAVIHSTTPDTKPNRVSQQAYFHSHVVVGDRDDKFIKAVRESRAYGQNGPDARLDEAIALWRFEGVAGKTGDRGLAEVFEPWAEHRLAPFHRVMTVNAGDLEDTLKSDHAINGIRALLLDNIPAASARTGVRLVIDTFTNPDSNARSGIVIHMLGDFDEDLVPDAKTGKPGQRRWFETPQP